MSVVRFTKKIEQESSGFVVAYVFNEIGIPRTFNIMKGKIKNIKGNMRLTTGDIILATDSNCKNNGERLNDSNILNSINPYFSKNVS